MWAVKWEQQAWYYIVYAHNNPRVFVLRTCRHRRAKTTHVHTQWTCAWGCSLVCMWVARAGKRVFFVQSALFSLPGRVVFRTCVRAKDMCLELQSCVRVGGACWKHVLFVADCIVLRQEAWRRRWMLLPYFQCQDVQCFTLVYVQRRCLCKGRACAKDLYLELQSCVRVDGACWKTCLFHADCTVL